jgi:hypothetical protein
MQLSTICLLVSAISLCAEEQAPAKGEEKAPPSSASSSSSSPKRDSPSTRRFSAGGYLSYSGLQLMNKGNATAAFTQKNATGTTTYATTPQGGHFGGGGTVQFALTGRFAADASLIIRREHFHTTSSSTISSKTSSTDEYSSADLLEMPILLRRYSKARSEPGARWFLEAGPSLRWTHNVRSSLQSTDTSNNVTCCTENPSPVAHRIASGFAAGGGFQFVDQFGIHVVPGVRYTRWLQPGFNNLSVRSNQNQVEAGIAITF